MPSSTRCVAPAMPSRPRSSNHPTSPMGTRSRCERDQQSSPVPLDLVCQNTREPLGANGDFANLARGIARSSDQVAISSSLIRNDLTSSMVRLANTPYPRSIRAQSRPGFRGCRSNRPTALRRWQGVTSPAFNRQHRQTAQHGCGTASGKSRREGMAMRVFAVPPSAIEQSRRAEHVGDAKVSIASINDVGSTRAGG